jgi:hypothetical protein
MILVPLFDFKFLHGDLLQPLQELEIGGTSAQGI